MLVSRKDNLSLKIGLLEICLGLEPAVAKGKDMLSNPHTRLKTLQRLIAGYREDEAWMREQLAFLRKARIEQKAFALKKLLGKAVKKARAFAAQKTVRKLKEQQDPGLRERLKEQLAYAKGLSLTSTTEAAFRAELLPLISGTDEGASYDELVRQNRAFQKELEQIKQTLSGFISSINHSNPLVPRPEASDGKPRQRQEASTIRNARPPSRSSGFGSKFGKTKGLESCFVGSLSEGRRAPGRDSSSGEERKNRPGQRERRKQWEQVFGHQARHIADKPKDRAYRQKQAGSKRPQKADAEALETVHPSWEAKRQQRAKLASSTFQGVKTTFDNDDA